MASTFIVCSYRRAEVLRAKTLALLGRCGVEPASIWVVVASAAEAAVYRSAIDAVSYGQLVVASKGLHNARNHVSQMIPAGQRLVFMDDDLEQLNSLRAPNAWAETRNLAGIVARGFDACAEHGVRLWGIYPVWNAFFMKASLVLGAPLVIGCMYSVLNSPELQLTLEEHEDFERTLQHVRADGRVIRFDDVAVKTRYWGPGGMSVGRDRKQLSAEAAVALQALFPGMIRGVRVKPNGITNPLIRRPRDTRRLPAGGV